MNTAKDIRRMTKIAEQSADHLSLRRPDWDWVDSNVWTERMLNALLSSGVQGGKWHSLIDKVYHPSNLDAAYRRVASNKGKCGVDGVTLDRYAQNLQHYQETLGRQLRQEEYAPHPVRRVYIDKPGSREKRPLGIPCVRDRVVQTALKHVIEPIFESTFHPSSYGFRPGLGCKDALREVGNLLLAGHCFVVDADIKSYFDQINHTLLMNRVRAHIADGRILDLVESFLHQGVMDSLRYWEPEAGTPQGAVVSPLLANIFLNPFDWLMHRHGIRCVRYADDFVLLCRTQAEADAALQLTRDWMTSQGLTLHPEKTRLVDMNTAPAEFTFLGYTFKKHETKRGQLRLLQCASEKSQHKLKTKLREPTKRCNGRSLPDIVARLNPVLRGWFGYFQHSHVYDLQSIDGFVRRRLRRILRKRSKRQGGSGKNVTDHLRWPNSFFAALGLFSLVEAKTLKIQSLRGTH